GENEVWAWPGPFSRAEPRICTCIAERGMSSLSESVAIARQCSTGI
ncbi:hypothetical protein A2U01_0066420, partial [Trifolium medium]|nr:hypothetical protein [Trifolium medium]